ncbi:maltose acetyltransferase domain-containing protein [Micromonospora sp. BRA006-A]|nr:maltose acetyltransferase domain-containing protein [Micromonospora sp. BRA006-A]
MTSMKDRMLAGEQYIADDPAIIADLERAALLSERFNRSSADDPAGRLARCANCSARSARTPGSGRRCTATTDTRRTSARVRSSTSTRCSSTSPASPSAPTSRSDRTCNCSPPPTRWNRGTPGQVGVRETDHHR